MDYILKEITVEKLYLIEGLWMKLNQLHLEDSKYFKEHFAENTFEKRCEKFKTKDCHDIKIEIIEINKDDIIGYCISTVNKTVGEIESLFIEQDYRQHGLGKILINKAVDWLKAKNCNKVLVAVADGHESVFDFYIKMGFYPKSTYLELKE